MEFHKKSDEELKQISPLTFEVVRHSATEPPFSSEYDNFFEEGIYVDIATGEPLFLSTTKFDSGCGWPAFSQALEDTTFHVEDHRFGMRRIEVRSKKGDSHLGHVFADGPIQQGGLRYCINGAALKFIPKVRMEELGYGEWLPLLDPANVEK